MIQPNDPNAPGPLILTDTGPRPQKDIESGKDGPEGFHVDKDGEIKPAAFFHKQYLETPIRGRRPLPLAMNRVRRYRRLYFTGKMTATEVASNLGWSKPATRNMLTGVTYWYA